MLPSVRATWAPRGHTPVLTHRFDWKRLSLAGALVYEPNGSDAHLIFELRPGAYNDETLIDFLTDVHALEQQRATRVTIGLMGSMTEFAVSVREHDLALLPFYLGVVYPAATLASGAYL